MTHGQTDIKVLVIVSRLAFDLGTSNIRKLCHLSERARCPHMKYVAHGSVVISFYGLYGKLSL